MTRQTEDTLSRSQEIARLAATKSFLLAASAAAKDKDETDDYCDDSEEDGEGSPLTLPRHQQRDSFIL